MTVLITLTIAGTDTGPFDLYSDVDGFVSAFETGVSKAALQAGYSSSLVPNGTTVIRVKSNGLCTNYIDITITTTTTTTSSTSSTTTTTTTLCPCVEGVFVEVATTGTINWADCEGTPFSDTFPIGPNVVGSGDCIQRDSVVGGTAIFTIEGYGVCCPTTTTTTTAAPPACINLLNETGGTITVNYTDCDGNPVVGFNVDPLVSFCALEGTVTGTGSEFLTITGGCF